MNNRKDIKILLLVAKILSIVFIVLGAPLIVPLVFGLITLFYIKSLENQDSTRNLTKTVLALIFFNLIVGAILFVDWEQNGKELGFNKNKLIKDLRKTAKIITIIWIVICLPLIIPSLIGFMVLKYLLALDKGEVKRSLVVTIFSLMFTNPFITATLLVDYLEYSEKKKITVKEVFKIIFYSFIVVFLFLYVFSIPALSGRPVWFVISYFFMAGLIGVTLLYTFIFTKFKFNKWLIVPFAFVLFAGVGTIFFSHQYRMWLTLALMMVTLITFYYAFVALDNTELIQKIFIYAFWLFGLYFAFVYRDAIIHLRISGNRIGTYFDNVNTIGFYFAIGFTISLFTALFSKSKIDLFYIIFALFFALLGFFTGSRAFLISLVVGTIIVMFFKLRKHKIIFFVGLIVVAGIYIGLINIPQFAFLKDQFDRTIYTLFGIGNSKAETSTVQRAIWPGYAFYLAGRNLLTGLGCDGFSIYSGVGTYAHNNFAEVMCDFGIIGFILFHACYVLPIVLSFKPKKETLFLVPVLSVIFLTRNLFGVTYYTKEAYLVLGLLFYLTKDLQLPEFERRKIRNSTRQTNLKQTPRKSSKQYEVQI